MAIYDRLGEAFLPLLPESMTFIAELMEVHPLYPVPCPLSPSFPLTHPLQSFPLFSSHFAQDPEPRVENLCATLLTRLERLLGDEDSLRDLLR